MNYLDNLGIFTLIPKSQQNRENLGNLPDDFAIYYFDEYKNVVICPEKHELTLDGEYDALSEKEEVTNSNYSILTICLHKL